MGASVLSLLLVVSCVRHLYLGGARLPQISYEGWALRPKVVRALWLTAFLASLGLSIVEDPDRDGVDELRRRALGRWGEVTEAGDTIWVEMPPPERV